MAIPSGTMVRGNNADLLERGVRKVYFQAYEDRVGEYQDLYNIATSEKQTEHEVLFAGLSQFTLKEEGLAPDFDAGTEAYKRDFTHLTYGLGFRLSKELEEDDLYGVVMRMGKELGRAAAYSQEVRAADTFNNSSATQYTAGGTNYPFLSTSHYRQDGGTWSNKLSSGADLSPESLEAALTQWRTGMVDQRGNKQMIPVKWLVVGPSDEWIAKRILMSTQRSFTADNDINPVKDLNLQLKVLTHMTDDGRWYLGADKPNHALMWFNRRPVTLETETDGSGTGNKIMVGTYRISFGASHPTGWFGSL